MKLNPMCHGKNDNIHFLIKNSGYKIKIVAFFDSGDAYILSSVKQKEIKNIDNIILYKQIKNCLSELDFELKTRLKGFLKIKIGTTENLMNDNRRRGF